MSIQYLINDKGERTAVVIPIEEWDGILEQLEGDEKSSILNGLKEAVTEMKKIDRGEIDSRSAKDVINELRG